MRIGEKIVAGLIVCSGLIFALVSPALAAERGNAADFTGKWDTHVPDVNASYELLLRVDGNTVVGRFFNSADSRYDGTLSGTVDPSLDGTASGGRLDYTYVQPAVGGAGGGYFIVGDDGTIAGFTHTDTEPSKKYGWEGKRSGIQAASPAPVPDGDMKLGTFGIAFCGAPAEFQVTSREGDRWVFDGMILIIDTGQYDELTIAQLSDDSLRITRRLDGTNSGPRQTVETDPPVFENGSAVWRAKIGRGAGCNNPGAFTDFRIPL